MSDSVLLPPAPLRECGAFLVAGATGVGKSELAVQLAERVGGEIVGADAFQVYRGLPILTAQPSGAQWARVAHHLVGTVPLAEAWDVARYLRAASETLREVRARGRWPIVVGGTGLYFRALQCGLAQLPEPAPELRAELNGLALPELVARLEAVDPAAVEMVDVQNPRRVVRALEICLTTGRPLAAARAEWGAAPGALRGVVLQREPEELEGRIARRTAAMWAEGLEEEVAAAAGALGPTASQTLGLREVQAVLAGELPRAEAQARVRLLTRQYAKRQRTWFRKEPALQPVELTGRPESEVLNEICDIWRRVTQPS